MCSIFKNLSQRYHITTRLIFGILVSSAIAGPVSAQPRAETDTIIVLDASGSMWGLVDDRPKYLIAQDAFANISQSLSSKGINPGLIAYGHRRKGDCGDIELISKPGATDVEAVSTRVNGLTPKGKTPLSEAVRRAAEELKFTEQKATIILLSDGVETCNADPCAVASDLEKLGIDFTAHVIGFDIKKEADKAQLVCLAENTGGQYFDAKNTAGLEAAIDAAVAEVAPEQLESKSTKVTIRLKMPLGLALPEETVVYSGDIELGRVARGNAVVPGLIVDLPLGPVVLRAEGKAAAGRFEVDIAATTDVVDLELTPDTDTYVIWQNTALPVGNEQVVLIANTSGADRSVRQSVSLYPLGSTNPADRIGEYPMDWKSGGYAFVKITSPEQPGDYEIVVSDDDGKENARIPLPFAAEVVPTWLGAREAEPGSVIDAYWRGDANRTAAFLFLQDGAQVSRHAVEGIAGPDGFKLPVPEKAGLYDLILRWWGPDEAWITSPLGSIAVGMSLPKQEADDDDPDSTAGMKAEADAMGGPEGPRLPVGDLHGDWTLLFANEQRSITLLDAQVDHDAADSMASGGLVVEAHPDWGFGPTGGFGDMTLEQGDDGVILMTVVVESGTLVADMLPQNGAFTGALTTATGDTHTLWLVPDANLAALQATFNSDPIDQQLIPRDERGERIDIPLTWTIQGRDMEEPDTLQSDGSRLDDPDRAPGTYNVTVTGGGLQGDFGYDLIRGDRRANIVVMRPASEGADLALDVDFYCSPGEDCNMTMDDVPIDFTLPPGWGAERPRRQGMRDATPVFNMTTNTPDGPFFVTLNQRMRMAALGPCEELLSGTFCHDHTDNAALLADVAVIRRSLSFRAVGPALIGDEFENMIAKLTGTNE